MGRPSIGHSSRRDFARRAGAVMGVVALVMLAILPSAHAKTSNDAREFKALRNARREWVHKNEVPAASAAMMKPGLRTRGLRYGGMLPTDPGRIASMSKAITAVCVARLIDDGRLSFTTRAGAVLAPV